MIPSPYVRLHVLGPLATRNPAAGIRDERAAYRARIRRAISTARWMRPIPKDVAVKVTIQVRRRHARGGDPDNVSKPVLDALRDVLGVSRSGRVRDDRIKWLEVRIHERCRCDELDVEIAPLTEGEVDSGVR